MHITGKTQIYGLIGDPTEYTRTPEVYNAGFAERGLDIAVMPLHIPRRGLSELIAAARGWQNLVGFGVTMPHKEAVTAHVDEMTGPAVLCGAVNVVRRDSDGRLTGAQLDGPGFGWSLEKTGFSPAGRTALIAGAGGTARAIAFELASRGLRQLTLTNRTAATSTALAAQVQRAYPKCTAEASPNPSGPFDLVINATSLGMKETDALPLPLDLLRPETTVADVVATVAQTALLKEAEARGCRTQTGPAMLQAQFEATLGFLDRLPAAGFGFQPESSQTAPRSVDHLPARPANPPNHAQDQGTGDSASRLTGP